MRWPTITGAPSLLRRREVRRRSLGQRSGLMLCAGALSACSPAPSPTDTAEVCQNPAAACVLRSGMSLQTSTAPKVLTPIEVTLRDVPITVSALRLEASMAGMSMPPVSIDLKGSGPSEWSGRLTLPVCSQGRSDWTWTLVTREGSGSRRTPVIIHVSGR